MAESPAHKFGQLVGNLLEEMIQPQLLAFCQKRGLYLDAQGARKPARPGSKVTWLDAYGNSHDFDFVIERGGSESKVGQPIAFIECAWRRYTKHSRNKAQEIQGAVLPVAEKHGWDAPFKGAVVAGQFTDGSLAQLRSLGFVLLHIPYDVIVAAFGDVGIDARFEEDTALAMLEAKARQVEALKPAQYATLVRGLTVRSRPELEKFLTRLEISVDRNLDFVLVVPLFGNEVQFSTILDAREFIDGNMAMPTNEFRKYEIVVRYTGGDTISASFADKTAALAFLDYVGRASHGSA